MTFKELIALCRPIDVSGPEPGEIGMLTQDSREVAKGSVFIAVNGTRVDGHAFIDDAIAKGATVVISEEPVYSDRDVCIIKVGDTRSLVGPLAQAFVGNPGKKLTLIGITGTNGKTTVATLTYQVLRKLGARPSLLGTVAKRIDDEVLDSLLTTSGPVELAGDMKRMVEAGSTHLVMEVSSHALEQKRTNGLKFQVAAFTNLSHDHLDYHATLEEYARSKKLLFDGLHPESKAIINADDDQAAFVTSDCGAEIIRFSFDDNAEINCSIISSTSKGLIVKVDGYEIASPLVGTFNAYNIAETFLICRALGFDEGAIVSALAEASGAAGRMERVEISGRADGPLVLVDYAHTPDALENVLSSLSSLKTARQTLHVIFGCGGNRDKTKRPKMAAISERYADVVTITSDNPRDEEPQAIIDDAMEGFRNPAGVNRIADRKKAIQEAIDGADKNTIILIAGKGHETYQEIKGVRQHFDDREIARKALEHQTAEIKYRGGV